MSRRDDIDPQFRESRDVVSRSTYADLPEHEIPSRILGTATTLIGAIVKPVAWLIERATRRHHR